MTSPLRINRPTSKPSVEENQMVKSTRDYGMFKIHPQNDQIDPANLKKVINSIKVKNLLQFRPILVDSQMQVIDGHHRLKAAESLGLELYYQVQEDANEEDIALLHANCRVWSVPHWIEYWASLGKKDYILLKEFCDKYFIKPMIAVKILNGVLSLSDTKTGEKTISQQIRDGSYCFPQGEEYANLDRMFEESGMILEMISRRYIGKTIFLRGSRIRQALICLMLDARCDLEVLKSKIFQRIESIHPVANVPEAYEMFRKIYNWRNSNPIQKPAEAD